MSDRFLVRLEMATNKMQVMSLESERQSGWRDMFRGTREECFSIMWKLKSGRKLSQMNDAKRGSNGN